MRRVETRVFVRDVERIVRVGDEVGEDAELLDDRRHRLALRIIEIVFAVSASIRSRSLPFRERTK